MVFEKLKGKSFTPHQDFMWVAEYFDGSYTTEFCQKTGNKNNFYSIKKDQLIRFGLVGQGNTLFFVTITGTFHLNGEKLYFSYRTSEKEYHLSGQKSQGKFNEIITYKDAYTDAIGIGRHQKLSSGIVQYNFGYKTGLTFEDGIKFYFQVIIGIPFNQPAYIDLKLVPNQDFDGELYIKRMGFPTRPVDAPLKQGVAGVCQFEL